MSPVVTVLFALSSNFNKTFCPALRECTSRLIAVLGAVSETLESKSKKNPCQACCPASSSIFNTLAEVFPVVLGLATISNSILFAASEPNTPQVPSGLASVISLSSEKSGPIPSSSMSMVPVFRLGVAIVLGSSHAEHEPPQSIPVSSPF